MSSAGARNQCWGNQNIPGCWDDEPPSSVEPIDFSGEAMVDLAVGVRHACAITGSGSLYCWGEGGDGALGGGGRVALGLVPGHHCLEQ